jgi:acetyl esterase/lipase
MRLRYGSHFHQFADLLVPDGDGPFPVAVLIHGGFWRERLTLDLDDDLARDLVPRGWAAWNIEYRRVGNGGGVPHTLDDVAAALDTLADRDVPLDRVIGLGHSAGGHLAMWAASRGRYDAWAAQVELTGVVSQAGVLDLWSAYDEGLGGGAVQAFLGHRPSTDDAAIDALHQVPLDVPVHCVHAIGDDVVPIAQSSAYVRAATDAGARAELTEIHGDHFTVIDPTTDAWQQTLGILDRL